MNKSLTIERAEALLKAINTLMETGTAVGEQALDVCLAEMEDDEVDGIFSKELVEHALRALRPIPMLLFCPNCGTQHIDAPDPALHWTNPPHRSHLCGACRHVWRPADVATDGVAKIQTRGEKDGDPFPVQRKWEGS